MMSEIRMTALRRRRYPQWLEAKKQWEAKEREREARTEGDGPTDGTTAPDSQLRCKADAKLGLTYKEQQCDAQLSVMLGIEGIRGKLWGRLNASDIE